MKYTEEQKEKLKSKNMPKLQRYTRAIPDIKIIDGFYVIESKLNLL